MMDLPDGGARRWAGRGAEGLTIVFSILLALAADAAWDYRRDRGEEARLLEGLTAEFREATVEIEADLARRDSILATIDEVLDVRTGRDLPLEAVPDVVTTLLDWRFYTPRHAIFDDALSSGRFDLIRSDGVRAALMSYEQQRRRLEVFDARERDFVADQLEPFLVEHLALDRLRSETIDPREAERLLLLLADSDPFRSLISIKRHRTDEATIFSRVVARRIDDVLAALSTDH